MIHKIRAYLNRKLNLSARNVEMVLGTYAVIKGLWLYSEKNFFFYPPSWTWIMDSSYLDIAIFLIGLLLLIFAVCETKYEPLATIRTNAIRVLLVMLGMIMLWLASLSIVHGIFTPDFRMAHSALGDLVIFVIIALTASDA